MNLNTKVVTTIAGMGVLGVASGENTPGLSTPIFYARSLVGDTCSNIYYSDVFNHRVRMIDHITGTVTTVAGTGTAGYTTGLGSASSEAINNPTGIWIDKNNTIYFSDESNQRIRSFQVFGASSCIDAPTSQPSSQPTSQPSRQPSSQPTSQPTRQPTRQPTSQPSGQPISRPTSQPSGQPTLQPSSQPTSQPSRQPSNQPSDQPTGQPSGQPSVQPSSQPTSQPSGQPSGQPSTQPSGQPSRQPSSQPSCQPTGEPTSQPTGQPSIQPTAQPSSQPSGQPTSQPSRQPSTQPTNQPSRQPTTQPTSQPSRQPSNQPASQPSGQPSHQPTTQPSTQPSGQPTLAPSGQPSAKPTNQPSGQPSGQPTLRPSRQPSAQPTAQPSRQPSSQPSSQPSQQPSTQPTSQPSVQPTVQPSTQPTGQPSIQPTTQPSGQPSGQPTLRPSRQPTAQPTSRPSFQPTGQPTSQPSCKPSSQPTSHPSSQPSRQPTLNPSGQPTSEPSAKPTSQPTDQPSNRPTSQPSGLPSSHPTLQPSSQPSSQPTIQPSGQPTVSPSSQPSGQPSSQPSRQPSIQPTAYPSAQPSSQPTSQPSMLPSAQPSCCPSSFPTSQPSTNPSSIPSGQPSNQPSVQPTNMPTSQPTNQPSANPSSQPTSQPSSQPSMLPTMQPSSQPTAKPSSLPSGIPTNQPTSQPSLYPSSQPSGIPSFQPTAMPSNQPTSQPSSIPTSQPFSHPTAVPSSKPSSQPSMTPTVQPSSSPSSQPSVAPSVQPTDQPSGQPSSHPTGQPSLQPSMQPVAWPTGQPSSHPSPKPTPLPSRSPTFLPTVPTSVGLIAIQLVEGDVRHFNPSNTLKLLGSIRSSQSCEGQWSAVDEGNAKVNLTSIASTQLRISVDSNIPSSVYLSLKSNTLTPGSLYSFHLSCGTNLATFLQVHTNKSPTFGRFSVFPISGEELQTVFTLETSGWIDDDIPLAYVFSYVAPSSVATISISDKTINDKVASLLPAGSSGNRFQLMVAVMVFDNYDAMASSSAIVVVKPIESMEQLKQLVEAQLTNPITSENVGKIGQFVSVASATVARNNCTKAPDCVLLHRKNCSSIANTCGECLDGYVGAAGSQNTLCTSETDSRLIKMSQWSSVNQNNTNKRSENSCNKDEDCSIYWEYCNLLHHQCEERLKSCPNDCSDHGLCEYWNLYTGEAVTNCTLFSTDCVAHCHCHVGYGGDACEWTTVEITAKRSLSYTLLNSLSTVTQFMNVSATNIVNTVANLNSLSQSTSYLQEESAVLVQQIAFRTLENVLNVTSVKYEDVQNVLSAIDTATQVQLLNQRNATSLAPSKLKTPDNSALLVGVVTVLDTFCKLVTRDGIPGEPAVTFLHNNFRLSTQQIPFSTMKKNVSVVMPQTALEDVIDIPASSMNIVAVDESNLPQNGKSREPITIQMLEINSLLNPLGVPVSGGTCNSSHINSNIINVRVEGVKEVVIAIHNTNAFNMSSASFVIENITTLCEGSEDVHVEEKVCSKSGLLLRNECSGKREVMIKYCPPMKTICNMLNMTTGDVLSNHSACLMEDYTPSYTYCRCQLASSVPLNDHGRKLSDGTTDSLVQTSGVLTVSSMSTYELNDIQTTLAAAPALTSPDALEKSLTVIILFASLWVGGLGLLFGSSWKMYTNNKQGNKVNIDKAKASIVVEDNSEMEANDEENKRDMEDPKKNVKTITSSRIKINDQIAGYVQSIFPSAFHDSPLLSRMIEEMWKNHRYISLLFGHNGLSRSGERQRIIAGVRLLSVQSLLMFLLALLYDLQAPDDDGSCVYLLTKETCLAKTSFMDRSQEYCQWNDHISSSSESSAASLSNASCQYADPVVTLKTSLYIALMVSCCSVVCSRPLDWLFDLLTAPTADSLKAKRAEQEVVQRIGRRMSNAAIGAGQAARRMSAAALSTMHKVVGGVEKKELKAGAVIRSIPEEITEAQQKARESIVGISTSMQLFLRAKDVQRQRIRQSMVVAGKKSPEIALNIRKEEDHRSAALIDSQHSLASVDEFQLHERSLRFQEAIFQQYQLLQGFEQAEFASQWGISEDGSFMSIPHQHTVLHILENELMATNRESKEKIKKLQIATDTHIGMEILHCFILDILGKDTPAARIYRSKADSEYHHTIVVTSAVKGIVICLIVVMNAFFVYYAMLKGYVRGNSWQNDYAMACVVQLLFEIFFFETFETFWMDFLIPSFVAKEVQAACHTLLEIVHRLCKESNQTKSYHYPKNMKNNSNAENLHFFNATEYFFVSNRVAKAFPNVMESMIVSSYVTPFPGELQWKWNKGRRASSASTTRMENNDERSRWLLTLLYGGDGWIQFFRQFSALSSGMVLLQHMAAFPYELQRMFIRFIQPFLLSGMVLIWQDITRNTWSIVLFIVLLIAVVMTIAYQYRTSWRRWQSNHIHPINDDVEEDKNENEKDESSLEQLNMDESESNDSSSSSSSGSNRSSESSDIGNDCDNTIYDRKGDCSIDKNNSLNCNSLNNILNGRNKLEAHITTICEDETFSDLDSSVLDSITVSDDGGNINHEEDKVNDDNKNIKHSCRPPLEDDYTISGLSEAELNSSKESTTQEKQPSQSQSVEARYSMHSIASDYFVVSSASSSSMDSSDDMDSTM